MLPVRQEQVEAALNSEPARRILANCIRKALSVKQLSDATGTPLPSTYRHIKTLVAEGLLLIERSALTPDGKPYDLYRSRLRRARIEITAGHVKVEWDLNELIEDRLHGMWNQIGGPYGN